MKKHHIFLLIISLLLVASLAFPNTTGLPTKHVLYLAADSNEIPSTIAAHDKLYIKKVMYAPRNTQVFVKVLQKHIGQLPKELSLDQPVVLIKSNDDDTPQEYYLIDLPKGTYILRITSKTYIGTIPDATTVFDREIEIISEENSKELNLVKEGDDGTY